MRRQRGFTLLIGMLLLLGMTLTGLALMDRGLLDIRGAFSDRQDARTFQQAESDLTRVVAAAAVPVDTAAPEETLQVRHALVSLERQQQCVTIMIDDTSVVAGETRPQCGEDNRVVLQRIENPCLDERLIRRRATGNGLVSCRYYDLRIRHESDSRTSGINADHELHRGLRETMVSAVSNRMLILSGDRDG
ncbi:hypothetical protein [Kushneria phosphatilytica]|uniref:Uncharacterized protein n=1 Tax=Kushneria phosphatilytica TaxID=657387 RepID=A0A1S1NY01_9GAMM|nr:hypothetical protein [Kushneria phosphatilytica]OHV11490.1 hypothetical protein BH688_06940 [Kushneria phosphatilytica]QEL12086.1 hypothetical protein FY550_13700 [Kushneria phosphatilytica]